MAILLNLVKSKESIERKHFHFVGFEHIQTRKESRDAPFRDNIQKCIMQLIGELDIPTSFPSSSKYFKMVI